MTELERQRAIPAGAHAAAPAEARRGWRGAARRLADHPGWQLALGGAVLAIAFPARLSGAVGLTIVGGALGVAVALAWPRLPEALRAPPARLASAVVIAMVATLGLSAFWDVLWISPDWQLGDWGPQHAVLAQVVPHLPGLDAPVWNHAVGTGDAPLELYPQLTYLVVGHVALLLGLEGDLPHAMMVVAVLVHVGTAVATAAIAMTVAPRPLALVVGALALVDSGAVAHGGTVGLFRWGLLHSALSLAFATVAMLGVLAALHRPGPRAAAAIWIGTALAAATHPAGLLGAAAALAALGAVALLAVDVPPRRALVAMLHVGLGLALGAAVWMPLAARILAYGQHFPNVLRTPARLLEDLLAAPTPTTAFAMLTYAAYLGILAGLWSRRARVVYVAATALVLLLGLCDAAYLAFDLAPGQGIARLGTERLAQLARPAVAAAGAYGVWIVAAHALAAWRGATAARRLVAAAAIGICVGALSRHLPALWASAAERATATARVLAPDPQGRAELVRWARQRVAEQRPDAWGRAMFETDTHEHFHLTALTGLPSFHLSAQPDLLLRERIQDGTDASLRRFNVRWVIAQDRSPARGDPATELRIGSFRIREVAGWDGQFARVERGEGAVRVTRLDDDAVEIDVVAPGPVLVALGTGYYPRWRARHASGQEAPVYAYPSHPTSMLHVVSAWVRPGRTVLTCDGPLPSDGRGALLAALALGAALAGLLAWRVPRWRVRALRRLARLRARAPRLAAGAARVGVPAALVALLARGCADERRPLRALALGHGVRATAVVEARHAGGDWERCRYEPLTATYTCPGLAVAYDAMAGLLNDAPPSWGFNTPAIIASAYVPGVELRATVQARLAGRYWAAASDGPARLRITDAGGADALDRELERDVLELSHLADRGPQRIEVTAPISVAAWSFTLVHEDAIIPRRPHLRPPPAAAP